MHILDNGDGQYVASYVPTKAGNYKLFIKLDGSSLPNSPFNVEVVPASASAANTEAFGDGLHNAMAGEPNGFKVQVRDRFNNNVRHGGDPITATITLKEDPSVTGPAEVKGEESFEWINRTNFNVFDITQIMAMAHMISHTLP